MQFYPLVRTKLYRPRTTRELVSRPRLSYLLSCTPDPALTLVCAAAGFGKTTLLNDWLEHCASPNAWLSLDERDSDLGVFLTYFIGAVRTIFPTACATTLQLLRGAGLPPLGRLVTALDNDLDLLAEDPYDLSETARMAEAALDDELQFGRGHPRHGEGRRFILVLDDYHLLKGRDVPAFLTELLAHPPRSLHLVISTRQEPPLPLHLLRARGELTEIRARDLRFTEDEVGAFMENALGVRLGPTALGRLAERTEGWATGLRLAALSIGAGPNLLDPDIPVLTDDNFAMEYLLNEVLDKVPLATQQFLLKTSILERLNGALCDAVFGPAVSGWDGHAYLEWLAKEGVFTFALDDEGTWYRYHHLFLKLLRSQLERQYASKEIQGLHASASNWFADNGLIDEAIEHALKSGDDLLAVQLLEAHRYEAMDLEQWRRLEHWLSLFPARLINSQPEAFMLEAWILQKQWRFNDLAPALARIEALLGPAQPSEPDHTRLRAELDVLHCVLSYYLGEAEQAAEYAERAMLRSSGDCSFVRGTAWFYRAAARQMKGDLQGALEVLQSGLEENRLHCSRLPMRLYTGLSIIYWNSCDLKNLLHLADEFLFASTQRDLAEATCWAFYFRGCALYEMNELAGAEAAFSEVLARRYVAHGFAFSQSALGMASIHLARGEGERAREVVESVSSHARETNSGRIAADADAFRAWLAACNNTLEPSWASAVSSDVDGRRAPLNTFVDPRLLRVRALLSLRTRASLALAATLLQDVHELAASGNNTRYLIETLALQALLEDLRGDRSAAMAVLRQAVSLAEPGRLIRVFVDLGPQMGVLLRQLRARSGPSEYLVRVVAGFGGGAGSAGHAGNKLAVSREYATAAIVPQTPQAREEGLIEPLSEREMDVLTLLAERYSNDEIAHTLHIAQSTVKRHAVNIYQKLQVGGRRAAVARAVALGLIQPLKPRRQGGDPKL